MVRYIGPTLPSLIELKAIRLESQHEGNEYDEGDVAQEEVQDEERDVAKQDDGTTKVEWRDDDEPNFEEEEAE